MNYKIAFNLNKFNQFNYFPDDLQLRWLSQENQHYRQKNKWSVKTLHKYVLCMYQYSLFSLWFKGKRTDWEKSFIECDFPMTPHVRPLVGWCVCHNFPKRAGSYTSMLLSEHLFDYSFYLISLPVFIIVYNSNVFKSLKNMQLVICQ